VLTDGGLPKIQALTQLEPNPPAADGDTATQLVVDPAAEINKDKISPHCLNISRSQFKTVSEMLEFLRYV
jgi:hypothetical protein